MNKFTLSLLLLASFTTPALVQANIVIPSGTVAANLQEDTRALGFARSRGQTFTVSENSLLSEFSFFVQSGTSPVDVDAAAYIFAFNDGSTSPTGTALYDSGAFAINSDGELNFSGLSVSLTAGQTYIAFLSTSGLQDQDNNSANIQANNTNPYADGAAYNYTGVLTDTSAFTSDPTNWNPVSSGWDFNFEATIAAVPEPSAYAFIIGFATIAFVAVRRR